MKLISKKYLCDLTKDALENVLKHSTVQDIVNLSLVNKKLNTTVNRCIEIQKAKQWHCDGIHPTDCLKLAAKINNEPLIKYYISCGGNITQSTLNNALEAYHIDIDCIKTISNAIDAKHRNIIGSEPTDVKIKKFKMDELESNAKICIIGRPRTGATTLIKDILYRFRNKIPLNIVMGSHVSTEYHGVIPDVFLYDSYDKNAMQNFYKRQQMIVRKYGADGQRAYNRKKTAASMIWDNLNNHHHHIYKENTTQGMYKNGRCLDMLHINSMQYPHSIPPSLRTCFDYIFVFNTTTSLPNQKKIWNDYAAVIPTFKMFQDIFENLTNEPHMCMVINNRVYSNNIEECISWYKPKLHRPFRCGSEKLWNYSHTLTQ